MIIYKVRKTVVVVNSCFSNPINDHFWEKMKKNSERKRNETNVKILMVSIDDTQLYIYVSVQI